MRNKIRVLTTLFAVLAVVMTARGAGADVICANKKSGALVTKKRCSASETQVKKLSELTGPAGPTGPAGAGGTITGKIMEFPSSCAQPDKGYSGTAAVVGTSYSASVASDGTFAIYNVLPGTYQVSIDVGSNYANPSSFSYQQGSTSGSSTPGTQLRTVTVVAGQTTTIETITTRANCCGNYKMDAGEMCDALEVGGATCTSEGGYSGGTLQCNTTCNGFKFFECNHCGNGVAETSLEEECDGADLNGKTCSTVSSGYYTGGSLACDSNCEFETANCTQ